VVARVVRKVDLHAGNKWRKDTVADLGRNPPVDLSSAAVGSSSTRRHPAGAQNAQI
jgi:hypothetical protein